MIKKKAEEVREKILLQARRVLTKLKPSKTAREVSNQEVQIMLYQYSSSENPQSQYTEEQFERIHEALSKLTKEQMEVLTRRYWNAESFAVIANLMGHVGDHKWAYRKEKEALEILSGELSR